MHGGFVVPVLDFITERMGAEATGGHNNPLSQHLLNCNGRRFMKIANLVLLLDRLDPSLLRFFINEMVSMVEPGEGRAILAASKG